MRSGGQPEEWKIVPLGGEPRCVFASPDPDDVSLTYPTLAALPAGRLVAALDQTGPGVKKLQGPKGRDTQSSHWVQGRILTSNDRGETWQQRSQFPFSHPSLFRDGASLYCLGHRGTLQITKSLDGGVTWSAAVALPAGSGAEAVYFHSPCRVLVTAESVHVALLKHSTPSFKADPAALLTMEIWRARAGADLTDHRSWTPGEPTAPFHAWAPLDRLDQTGMPFYACPAPDRGRDVGGRRWASPPGWMEPHVLPLVDPDHTWYEPGAENLFVLSAVRLHRANMGMILRLDQRDGRPLPTFIRTPSGRGFTFLNLPGGHRPFDVLYDDVSRRYWLVSNRAADSMRRPDRLPPSRPGLPEDELDGLQLHVSTNLVDWEFTGLVARPAADRLTLLNPSMAVRGAELSIVCRSGGANRRRPHDTDRVLLFQIPNFRDLASL